MALRHAYKAQQCHMMQYITQSLDMCQDVYEALEADRHVTEYSSHLHSAQFGLPTGWAQILGAIHKIRLQ